MVFSPLKRLERHHLPTRIPFVNEISFVKLLSTKFRSQKFCKRNLAFVNQFGLISVPKPIFRVQNVISLPKRQLGS